MTSVVRDIAISRTLWLEAVMATIIRSDPRQAAGLVRRRPVILDHDPPNMISNDFHLQ